MGFRDVGVYSFGDFRVGGVEFRVGSTQDGGCKGLAKGFGRPWGFRFLIFRGMWWLMKGFVVCGLMPDLCTLCVSLSAVSCTKTHFSLIHISPGPCNLKHGGTHGSIQLPGPPKGSKRWKLHQDPIMRLKVPGYNHSNAKNLSITAEPLHVQAYS